MDNKKRSVLFLRIPARLMEDLERLREDSGPRNTKTGKLRPFSVFMKDILENYIILTKNPKAMQPKLFNPTTFAGGGHGPHKTSTPAVRLHKQGAISLSVGAVKLLKLKTEDGIILIQDEDVLSDWYIGKSDKGFIVRGKKGGSLVFNHQRLRSEIIKSAKLSLTNTSVRMIIATKPTMLLNEEVYPIITESGRQLET